MTEEYGKTLNDAVKEVKSRKISTDITMEEKTLIDEFAMAALTGLISTNSLKDAPRRSYIFAQEMMEMRVRASKEKLKL